MSVPPASNSAMQRKKRNFPFSVNEIKAWRCECVGWPLSLYNGNARVGESESEEGRDRSFFFFFLVVPRVNIKRIIVDYRDASSVCLTHSGIRSNYGYASLPTRER